MDHNYNEKVVACAVQQPLGGCQDNAKVPTHYMAGLLSILIFCIDVSISS